ncbi:MAG TPA: type II toxin-antitoxin system Phd/YefM family antitoxin [Acidobacteriaceae bacterium]|nr:type II toxin-antitoxin system Phd/YefM family antitoxin [Acidobacteriaceae bacterium]
MTTWRATEAKAKFSAVLDKAKKEGPQVVRRRDEEFIVSTRLAFLKRTAREVDVDEEGKTSGQRLWERLRCPPPDGIDVELERPNWAMREVEF